MALPRRKVRFEPRQAADGTTRLYLTDQGGWYISDEASPTPTLISSPNSHPLALTLVRPPLWRMLSLGQRPPAGGWGFWKAWQGTSSSPTMTGSFRSCPSTKIDPSV